VNLKMFSHWQSDLRRHSVPKWERARSCTSPGIQKESQLSARPICPPNSWVLSSSLPLAPARGSLFIRGFAKLSVRFIEPMECLPVAKVPEGDRWTYELKLDGYRLEAVKSKGKVALYSRRGSDLTKRFDYVAKSLPSLPDDTVVDGELVALDEEGKPSFARVLRTLTALPPKSWRTSRKKDPEFGGQLSSLCA